MLAREAQELKAIDPSTPEGLYNAVLTETGDADLAGRIRATVLAERRLRETVKEQS